MQRLTLTSFWSRYRGTKFEDHELSRALARLPAITPAGPWLAGGAVRRLITETPLDSDFDFFFASADQLAAFTADLEAKGGKKTNESEFNITFLVPPDEKRPALKVQAIRVSFQPTLEATMEAFDFSLCQCGYDGTDLVLGDFTLYDLARRRLVPGRISFGVSSLRRMLKYTRQGYTVCSGGLAKMLEQIVADPTTINSKVVSID